jgi:hypothetical protein
MRRLRLFAGGRPCRALGPGTSAYQGLTQQGRPHWCTQTLAGEGAPSAAGLFKVMKLQQVVEGETARHTSAMDAGTKVLIHEENSLHGSMQVLWWALGRNDGCGSSSQRQLVMPDYFWRQRWPPCQWPCSTQSNQLTATVYLY